MKYFLCVFLGIAVLLGGVLFAAELYRKKVRTADMARACTAQYNQRAAAKKSKSERRDEAFKKSLAKLAIRMNESRIANAVSRGEYSCTYESCDAILRDPMIKELDENIRRELADEPDRATRNELERRGFQIDGYTIKW